MHKAMPFNAAATQELGATTGRVLRFPGTADRGNRTSVCAVLFLDIVEYSKRPVSEQLQIKDRFNTHVADAIADIPVDERIVLDTGDGVAITLLGDPEDALFVAMNLTAALAADTNPVRIWLRGGINLGPVRLVRDINSQPNIIGDGINVAQRVMSFADPGTVLVSRSYYEVVTRICEDYGQLFKYQGARTDKHVREHELYEVVSPTERASELTRLRSDARRLEPTPGSETLTVPAPTYTGLLRNRTMALAVTTIAVFALAAAALPYVVRTLASEPVTASTAMVKAPVSPMGEPAAAQPDAAPPASAGAAPRDASEPARTPAKPSTGRTAETPTSTRPAPSTAPAEPALAGAPELAREAPQPEAHSEPRSPMASALKPGATLAKTPGGPTALVLMAISPWGEVLVNGKSVGVSPPLSELEVSPGKYRIEIRNGAFKPYEEVIELGSNQTVRIKHKFTTRR